MPTMPSIVESVRDATYAAIGVQVLSYERFVRDVNERFGVDERLAEARAKGAPVYERLTERADAMTQHMPWLSMWSRSDRTDAAS